MFIPSLPSLKSIWMSHGNWVCIQSDSNCTPIWQELILELKISFKAYVNISLETLRFRSVGHFVVSTRKKKSLEVELIKVWYTHF